MTIQIAPLQVEPPRDGDKWFMEAVMEAGFTREEELLALNRFRCHQQVLYLFDVLDARGRLIYQK